MKAPTDIRSHFGLVATPFTREIPVNSRWRHEMFDEALGALRMTVEDRMSAALISPAGTGKTMLLRTLVSQLPEARYKVTYVKVTSISKREFCQELAKAMGCGPAAQYNSLVRRLQDHLVSVLDQHSLRPVLIIDEAHDMRPDVLAILRVLTNFEMDSRLVVSIVLCGQPPLARMLERSDLEAVSRRLAHYETLRNLTREETRKYVYHRLSAAGGRTDLFEDAAYDAIYEIARGNLRATDRLALKGLQLAAIDGQSAVDATQIAAARRRLWP